MLANRERGAHTLLGRTWRREGGKPAAKYDRADTRLCAPAVLGLQAEARLEAVGLFEAAFGRIRLA